ncbi:MAG TPA: hypothetical protein VLL48_07050, partial [Longimicrobiales bacterium]|nr:hypothetical protein [Longimicrobiales bacterium]
LRLPPRRRDDRDGTATATATERDDRDDARQNARPRTVRRASKQARESLFVFVVFAVRRARRVVAVNLFVASVASSR